MVSIFLLKKKNLVQVGTEKEFDRNYSRTLVTLVRVRTFRIKGDTSSQIRLLFVKIGMNDLSVVACCVNRTRLVVIVRPYLSRVAKDKPVVKKNKAT